MREIKFRAWHKPNKEMVYFDFVKMARDNIQMHHFCLLASNKHGDGKDLLMQYTGLKDRNGAPIYEGDIVETTDSMAAISASSVSWNNENATFWLDAWDEWLGDTTDDLEVIGNIYENQNLLEDES